MFRLFSEEYQQEEEGQQVADAAEEVLADAS
jgi:hypothetical protein